MVKRKLNFKRVFVCLFLLFLIIGCLCFGFLFYQLTPVDKSGEAVNFEVKSGQTVNEIFEDLENQKLIRSALIMKVYSKLVGGLNVKAGSYSLNSKMDTIEIFNTLSKDGKSSRDSVSLVFKEGRNIRDLASLLESITEGNIKKDQFISKMNDSDYLNSLINEYWFLTEEIIDEDIYYPLEGYLFPNTYEIYKDASIEDVVTKMLNTTNLELMKRKSEIEASGYSVHELMTLASIVELESANSETRKDIAGVFVNRLNDDWSLGGCVSTYYAFNINMGDRDLNMSEINDCSSKYNTRCTSFVGLPIGPIGNPGADSIEASINPNKHSYYYFLSDKDMNTYFSKTQAEHDRKGRELRANGQMLYN